MAYEPGIHLMEYVTNAVEGDIRLFPKGNNLNSHRRNLWFTVGGRHNIFFVFAGHGLVSSNCLAEIFDSPPAGTFLMDAHSFSNPNNPGS